MAETAFEQVAAMLPETLRKIALALPENVQMKAEEVRLRCGWPLSVVCEGGEEYWTSSQVIEPELLYCVLEIVSGSSVHIILERLKQGFVTAKGGHRIGVCGCALMEGEQIKGFMHLTSLNIRIAREKMGIACKVAPQLFEGNALRSTLILAPPGGGKTTFLRDLIRCISEGDSVPPLRVGVVDERGELGAMWNGAPQMSLGRRTDILEGAPKGEGLLLLLRGMGPQVLAADEITAPQDILALEQAAGCGVSLLATAHGKTVKDIYLRPVYRKLLEEGIFRCVVCIDRAEDGGRNFRVEELPC